MFQAAGLFCDVTDGTILGLLKFESSLPWEIDADLQIETGNVTTFYSRIAPNLRKLGYSVVSCYTGSVFINAGG